MLKLIKDMEVDNEMNVSSVLAVLGRCGAAVCGLLAVLLAPAGGTHPLLHLRRHRVRGHEPRQDTTGHHTII